MDTISELTNVAAMVIYGVLAVIALWGSFCVIMVWRRVAESRFRSEQLQNEFLAKLDRPLAEGDFDGAARLLEDDIRAVPQLAQMAIRNREIGYSKVRQLVLDRFQRDILSDLDQRLSWVNTVIKSAPMVGLLGTVVGMMGAFGKLTGKQNVNPDVLAGDISVALITTASGLAIAIPLVLCATSINVRIRKLEDLVAAGMAHFFERFREGLGKSTQKEP